MIWVYIGIGVVVVVGAFLVWSVKYTNKRMRRGWREIKLEEIDTFAGECVDTFREKFGLQLELENLEGSTLILDKIINKSMASGKGGLMRAFGSQDSPWYYSKPVGAFLAELIRMHREAGWQEEEAGSLSIWLKDGDDEVTINPFKMVHDQAHANEGSFFRDLFVRVYPAVETSETEPVAVKARGETIEDEGIAKSSDAMAEKPVDAKKAEIEKKLESGANWFFWVAGLSLINSIAFLAGSEWGFIFGLGITQVIDAIALDIGGEGSLWAKVIAFSLDVCVAAVFALFAFLGKRRYRRAFIIGIVLYLFDGLIFLLAQDFLSVLFHVIALYGILGGFKACRVLRAEEKLAEQKKKTALKPETLLKAGSESLIDDVGVESKPREIVWHIVIATISVVYAILYALITIRSLPNTWKIAGCALIAGGALGIVLKRKAGPKLAWGGSSILIVGTVYRFFKGFSSQVGPVPVVVVVAMSIFLFILIAWPLFLVIWFLRQSIREHVNQEWE